MTNHAHSDERDWQSDAGRAIPWLLAGLAIDLNRGGEVAAFRG